MSGPMRGRPARRGGVARLACAAAAAVLAACAGAPVSRGVPDDALFTAEGRMSVASARPDGPADASNGRFDWIERGGRSEITLYSPLGDTLARIDVLPHRSVLRTPKTVDEAATPEILLDRVLGLPLPVSGLRDWLRGRARGGAQRAPQPFDEDGWHISYPQMQDDGRLPRVVRLERALPSAVDVRIVIERWGRPEVAALAAVPADDAAEPAARGAR